MAQFKQIREIKVCPGGRSGWIVTGKLPNYSNGFNLTPGGLLTFDKPEIVGNGAKTELYNYLASLPENF